MTSAKEDEIFVFACRHGESLLPRKARQASGKVMKYSPLQSGASLNTLGANRPDSEMSRASIGPFERIVVDDCQINQLRMGN